MFILWKKVKSKKLKEPDNQAVNSPVLRAQKLLTGSEISLSTWGYPTGINLIEKSVLGQYELV